jgi:tripartite-type tricarboxylate transporter receptor subunit TctC
MTTSKRSALLSLAALLALGGTAFGQTYPTRQITLVVPFPAGGPTDAIARIVAEGMRTSLGQPVIIENVAGAGGNVGVGRVARASADGYTMVVGNSGTHVFNGAMYSLNYDLVKDFEPIALAARESVIIVGRKSLPANDLSGLIAWLKATPNATQATAGIGTPPHLAGILFQSMSGARAQFVPYRGAAPAMQDLLAEQVDFDITSPVTTLPQIRIGAIKAYAVAAKIRLAVAPGIPTVDEAGLPGFYAGSWFAFFGPRGVPKEVVAKLSASITHALADPAVRQRITDLGFEIPSPDGQTAKALAAAQHADIEKWWPIIKAAGVKID